MEDYWKLIGNEGVVIQDSNEETLYASFSKQRGLLLI